MICHFAFHTIPELRHTNRQLTAVAVLVLNHPAEVEQDVPDACNCSLLFYGCKEGIG